MVLVTRFWGIFGRPHARTRTGFRAGPREAALIQALARMCIHELGLMQQPSFGSVLGMLLNPPFYVQQSNTPLFIAMAAMSLAMTISWLPARQ